MQLKYDEIVFIESNKLNLTKNNSIIMDLIKVETKIINLNSVIKKKKFKNIKIYH